MSSPEFEMGVSDTLTQTLIEHTEGLQPGLELLEVPSTRSRV